MANRRKTPQNVIQIQQEYIDNCLAVNDTGHAWRGESAAFSKAIVKLESIGFTKLEARLHINAATRHPPGEHRRGNITFIGADLRAWLPPPRRYVIAFAFPPCTNLAVSGARWFREKGIGGLTEALEVVEACRRICDWTGAPWMIENPVSTLSSYWRAPDFTFHPHQFGGWPGGERDDYGKRTCLWTGGGFRLPQPRPIPEFRPLYIHNLPPSDDRGDLRSITPPGFARAVFEANVGRAAPLRA